MGGCNSKHKDLKRKYLMLENENERLNQSIKNEEINRNKMNKEMELLKHKLPMVNRVCKRLEDQLQKQYENMPVPGNPYGGTAGNNDIYKMTADKRGYCCAFPNQNYVNDVRIGADLDMKQLCDVFRKLHFEIYGETDRDRQLNHLPIALVDLKAADILRKLDDIVDNQDELRKHDAFIAIFSGYGNCQHIIGIDNVKVEIDEIIAKFNSINCPSLADKPKIFIFISNRDNKIPECVEIPKHKLKGNNCWDSEENEMERMAIYDNIFICYSIESAVTTLSESESGTFYGNILAKNIELYAKDTDFETILKIFAKEMRDQNIKVNGNDLKLMSSTRSINWIKKLYFNPGFLYDPNRFYMLTTNFSINISDAKNKYFNAMSIKECIESES